MGPNLEYFFFQQKRANRERALKESSSISPEMKAKYADVMSTSYMSSEGSASESEGHSSNGGSSDEEGEPPAKAKKLAVRSLPWRSDCTDAVA